MKRKSTLLSALFIACIFATIVIGSTYAYFIDDVQSTGNVIKAGNLNMKVEWATTPDATAWNNLADEDAVVFNNSRWEPNHTQVRYIRISNTGELAFQYRLDIVPMLTTENPGYQLGNVIEAYVEEVGTGYIAPTGYQDLANKTPSGTVASLITSDTGAYYGQLLQPDHSITLAVVLHMDHEAGNEYQGLSVGEGFQLKVYATQTPFERDAFGTNYDQGAELPKNPFRGGVASMPVNVVNGVTKDDVTLDGGEVHAFVPAGTRVNPGTTVLTLRVTTLDKTASGVTAGDGETLLPVDVHIEGVAEDNESVIIVTLDEVLITGLNIGNTKLYHVEDGQTVKMEQELTAAKLDTHNEYYYNPANGTLMLAMDSFSEVAVVAADEAVWKGEVDHSWYDPDAEILTIKNADQLWSFSQIVGGMTQDKEGQPVCDTNGEQIQDSFKGQTIQLVNDIDLNDDEDHNNASWIFYPIGYYNSTGSYEKVSGNSVTSSVSSFEGTFDGQGHTIANFYQNTWEMFGDYNNGYSGTPNHYKDAMGLFGYVLNGTVKNLTVDNFSSDGEFTPTGVIAAYADGDCTFENIAITNCNPRVYNTGNGGIIGIAGDTTTANDDHITLKNITVDNTNKISALWGSWDVACGGLVGMYRGNVDGDGNATGDTISFTNCHVSAIIDVYNDVCANYQYYAYRYSGMIIGSVRHNTTNDDGKTIPNMAGISATGCTVNYGDWNDYYYCEFEKNTMASYSEDYQFSRVPHSELNFTDSNGNGVVDADERASVTGCKHTHTAEENHQAIYLPFHQLFTGYSWGVSSIGLEKYSGIVTNLDITEGDQDESVEKFETKFTGDFLYRVGNQNTVALGSLFGAKEGATINDSGVYVTIEKVDENMDVGGTFSKSESGNWEDDTIKFSGTGVVRVTIQDYNFCTPTVLYLEVVDAKNITEAKGTTTGGNFVLLQDVNTTSYVNYWNCTLYGNGFTYSLNGAPTAYNSKQGHGILITKNATLDNLVIVGDVYNSYGAYTNQDNYNAAIDVLGETTIQNCYISGCAAPVLARASVTITDTTLYGGTVANLLIKSGVVTLKNVTTVNYADGRTLVGMGIVIHSDATEATKLVLNGKLTQYNFISETNTPTDSNARMLYDAMFDSACGKYHFGTSPNRYVNTGIISMTEKFGKANIVDNANTGYVGSDANVNNVDGYVYTQPNTSGSVNNGYVKENDSHVSTTQGPVAPSYSFDHTKNAQEEDDGSNDYCYEENGIVYISMDEGDTFTWDTSILTAKKLGQELDYTVSMNGTDYTGKSIAFNTAGSYEVVYTYTDDSNYGINADGNIITYNETYTKTVYITVLTVKSEWKSAEIKVNDTAMSGIYVMSGDYDYSYKMKFLDCVTITDYDEAGNAITVDLSKNIKSTSFVDTNGANPGKFDANKGTVTITYNDGKVLTVEIGAWSGSGPSTKTCSVKSDDGVYLITDGASNAANTGVTWKITGYTYTGNNGALVSDNTTITFTWDTNSEGYNSKSECITPDTLITLADGSQKRVDSLTGDEMLLVWNLETGAYDAAPIVFVDSEEEAEYEVIHLYFSDDTDVKVIYEHGYFDVDLGKYVYLDKDAAQYIGHRFIKQGSIADNDWEVVTLTDVMIETEVTTAWSPVTFSHLCYYTNGMLSMPGGIEGLFNIFDVDVNTMVYDAAKKQADINTYGLYTYDDFDELIPEAAYEAFNGAYLKVAIGKGMLTWDDIARLAERYVPLMPQ